MATTYNIKMTCEIDGAEIHYETSGSADIVPADPTKSSSLYSSEFGLSVSSAGAQISAKAFKDGMEDSDAITKIIKPITVPMALPDGSVLFYARGQGYGEYHIGDDGYPVRNDGAMDDGSAESKNWRYLICDSADLESFTGDNRKWGISQNENLTGTTDIGYGLPNTNSMISDYVNKSYSNTYWWKWIKEKRDSTGFNWFMPSHDELYALYTNKDDISSLLEESLSGFYWSSTEYNKDKAYIMGFSTGETYDTLEKSVSHKCRVIRRI